MTREQETEILDKCIALVTKLSGKRPTGYVAPWWEFSPVTNELLLERGIVTAAARGLPGAHVERRIKRSCQRSRSRHTGRLPPRHALHTQREGDGDDGRQSLGHRRYGQAHRGEKEL